MAATVCSELSFIIKKRSEIVHKSVEKVNSHDLSRLIGNVSNMKAKINEKLTELVNEELSSASDSITSKTSHNDSGEPSEEDDDCEESEEPKLGCISESGVNLLENGDSDGSVPQVRVKSLENPSEDDLNESVVNLKKRLDMLKSIVQEDKPLPQNHTMIDDNFLSILFAVALASIIGVTLYAFQGLYAAVTRKWDNKA